VQTAILTAAVSVFVAVLGFLLNQRAQLQLERRRARLERVNAQLRSLYGPLFALVETNERVWRALRDDGLPDQANRVPAEQLGVAERERWEATRNDVLAPLNERMNELIVDHADLLIEREMPAPLLQFCAHVTGDRAPRPETASASGRDSLVPHPGRPYVEYVRTSFATLKEEQFTLLRLTAPRRSR
jgi:hypothetical protein